MTDRAESGWSGDFDQLVSEHRNNVYGVVLGVVSDPDLAADVVQETFIRAWRGIARFRGDSSLGTWLHRIAVNTALTARRRAAGWNRRAAELDDDLAADATADVDPEKRGEVLDLRRTLEAALDTLPDGQKAVVVLKDVEGWSHAEIARRLGITESAAKVRLHRAHRRLATLLEAMG
jgi:RNA polymerase sigma-70 factor (ECF subfamily)